MFSPHLLPVHYIIVMSLSEGGSRQKRRESSRSCSECCNRFRVQTQGWTKEENKICSKIVLCSEQGWSGGGLSCNHLIFEVLDEDGRYTRLALAQRMIWWDRGSRWWERIRHVVEIEGVAPDVGLGCAQRTFNATVFAIVIKFYFAHALVLHCKF